MALDLASFTPLLKELFSPSIVGRFSFYGTGYVLLREEQHALPERSVLQYLKPDVFAAVAVTAKQRRIAKRVAKVLRAKMNPLWFLIRGAS